MAISIPRYTVDDLDDFPDDGNRYELLDGTLLVTPCPGSLHQGVVARIMTAFAPLIANRSIGLFAGGVVRRSPLTHLEPDLLVVPPQYVPGTQWDHIADHWLAIEVLSPSSRIYDRQFKRDAYFALGVHEVWIVDAIARTIDVSKSVGVVTTIDHNLRWQSPDESIFLAVDVDDLLADTIASDDW